MGLFSGGKWAGGGKVGGARVGVSCGLGYGCWLARAKWNRARCTLAGYWAFVLREEGFMGGFAMGGYGVGFDGLVGLLLSEVWVLVGNGFLAPLVCFDGVVGGKVVCKPAHGVDVTGEGGSAEPEKLVFFGLGGWCGIVRWAGKVLTEVFCDVADLMVALDDHGLGAALGDGGVEPVVGGGAIRLDDGRTPRGIVKAAIEHDGVFDHGCGVAGFGGLCDPFESEFEIRVEVCGVFCELEHGVGIIVCGAGFEGLLLECEVIFCECAAHFVRGRKPGVSVVRLGELVVMVFEEKADAEHGVGVAGDCGFGVPVESEREVLGCAAALFVENAEVAHGGSVLVLCGGLKECEGFGKGLGRAMAGGIDFAEAVCCLGRAAVSEGVEAADGALTPDGGDPGIGPPPGKGGAVAIGGGREIDAGASRCTGCAFVADSDWIGRREADGGVWKVLEGGDGIWGFMEGGKAEHGISVSCLGGLGVPVDGGWEIRGEEGVIFVGVWGFVVCAELGHGVGIALGGGVNGGLQKAIGCVAEATALYDVCAIDKVHACDGELPCE